MPSDGLFSRLRAFSDVGTHLHVSEPELRGILNNLRHHWKHGSRPKKNGERRHFWKPSKQLKPLQKRVQRWLRDVALAPYICGGVKGKSILDSAKPHVGRNFLVKSDIRRFFPSIRPAQVRDAFVRLGCADEAAGILTALTTWRHELPQGAPTSSALANLVALDMAGRLAGLAASRGAQYTVFVDDHSMSAKRDLTDSEGALRRIVRESGFRVHPDKSRCLSPAEEQVVTGVRVDGHVDVPSEKWSEIQGVFETALSRGWAAVPLGRKKSPDPLQCLVGRHQYVAMLNTTRARALAKTLGAIIDRWGFPPATSAGIRRLARSITGAAEAGA